MKNIRKKILILTGIFALFITALAASAVPVFSVTDELKNEALGQIQVVYSDPLPPADPRLWIGKVIQVFLSLLGAIFLILLVLAGYWFLTAKGEEEQVKKGLDTAKRAVFGLIITLLAYSITGYVMNALTETVVK